MSHLQLGIQCRLRRLRFVSQAHIELTAHSLSKIADDFLIEADLRVQAILTDILNAITFPDYHLSSPTKQKMLDCSLPELFALAVISSACHRNGHAAHLLDWLMLVA